MFESFVMKKNFFENSRARTLKIKSKAVNLVRRSPLLKLTICPGQRDYRANDEHGPAELFPGILHRFQHPAVVCRTHGYVTRLVTRLYD